MDIPHYPKTQHISSSKEKTKIESSDYLAFKHLDGKKIVIEEKVDAQAIGIFFKDDYLHLLFRGQYFCLEKNIAIPKELRNAYEHFKNSEELYFEIIQDNRIMYGEWMEYIHTVQYDKLPSLFLEYDIYDKKEKEFLSTNRRMNILKPFPEVNSVHVYETIEPFDFDSFKNIINNNKLSQYAENISHEGFYIKVENDNEVLERFKWIEPKFFNSVIQSEHWRNKELKRNKMR